MFAGYFEQTALGVLSPMELHQRETRSSRIGIGPSLHSEEPKLTFRRGGLRIHATERGPDNCQCRVSAVVDPSLQELRPHAAGWRRFSIYLLRDPPGDRRCTSLKEVSTLSRGLNVSALEDLAVVTSLQNTYPSRRRSGTFLLFMKNDCLRSFAIQDEQMDLVPSKLVN